MASTKTDPQLLTLGRAVKLIAALDDAGRRYLIARLEAEMGHAPVAEPDDDDEREPVKVAG